MEKPRLRKAPPNKPLKLTDGRPQTAAHRLTAKRWADMRDIAVEPARLGVLALLFFACAPRSERSDLPPQSFGSTFVPKADPNSDKVPWASAFVNFSMEKSGIRGTRSPSALSWLNWGVPLDGPAAGAIAVLDYGDGRGHVGVVEGVYHEMIVLIGGNQSDSVNRTAFSRGDIVEYRWPEGQDMPPKGKDLPTIRPEGALDTTPPSRPAKSPGRSRSVEVGKNVEYRLLGNGQSLTVERIDKKRIRFALAGGTCARKISGIGYAIYEGDVEIDSDAGVGYPADQYFFWGDELGKKGLSIRLSLFEPGRAKVSEWGYGAVCSFAGNIMRVSGAE
jgi:uncharacterized protein (TIGR02594 family)